MLLAASRCATCLFSGARTNVEVATAVRVVVVHCVPGVEAAAVVAVFTVIVVVPVVVVVVVVVDGPPWFRSDAQGKVKDEITIWDLQCVCRTMRADCQWCRSHRM